LRVLYLFAGVKRKSDLGSFLRRRCRISAVSLAIEEVDVLRDGRRHNLLSGTRKSAYLGKISRGLRCGHHVPSLRHVLEIKMAPRRPPPA